MTVSKIEIVPEQKRDAVSFVFPGDVLSTTAESLRLRLEEVLRDRPAGTLDCFEADLRAARMVDSVGLNLLVWLWRAVTGRGGRLRVLVSSPDVERTFKFTRFSERADVQRIQNG